MAQFTITVPDAVVPRVLDAYAVTQGYTGTRPDGTAETRAQFLRRRLIEHVKSVVREYEANREAQVAAAAARTAVDSEITLS